MGRKFGESLPPFWGQGLGPHLTQSRLAEAYLHIKWHLDLSSRLTAVEMGRNWGGLRSLFVEGGWVWVPI